nr:hypothetical protein [Gemmatimonadaceae bacterium]
MPTYARRRLRLGIGAVGATVLLALVALVADLPHRLIPGEVDATVGGTLAAVLAALLVHAAVLVPFDVAGGLVVVRARPDPVRWSLRVLRAIVAQLAIVLVGIALVMRIAMQFGTSAAIAVTALLQLALLHRQGALARLASGVRTSRPPAMLVTLASEVGLAPSRVRVAEVADEPAFTGGWVGLQAPA